MSRWRWIGNSHPQAGFSTFVDVRRQTVVTFLWLDRHRQLRSHDKLLEQIFLEEFIVVALAAFFARVIVELAFADSCDQNIFQTIHRQVFLLLDTLLQALLVKLDLPLHDAVPVVFDSVVSPALDDLGQNGPLVAIKLVKEEQQPLLVFVPAHFSDVGVQVVVPALPALFALPSRHVGRDGRPASRSEARDEIQEDLVLFGCPYFLRTFEIYLRYALALFLAAVFIGGGVRALFDSESDFSRFLTFHY